MKIANHKILKITEEGDTMKTIIAMIAALIIMFVPLSICSATHTDNPIFIGPSIVWVFLIPMLILIFYDNIEGLFSKDGKQK